VVLPGACARPPTPQTPTPNPQSPIPIYILKINLYFFKLKRNLLFNILIKYKNNIK
jgi:hypothetical protein